MEGRLTLTLNKLVLQLTKNILGFFNPNTKIKTDA